MDPYRKFLNRFKIHFREIDRELETSLRSRIAMIEDIGRHSISGEGKRLRPLLFVLSSLLCGYQGDDIYRLSSIFEYVHGASLLHNDVIDNAKIRRNMPSASNIWGNSAAVLTGDYLSSRAMAIAVNTNNIEFLRL